MEQLLLITLEGLIFAIFAFGIYLSFQWLKFPDLTPDGSFVIGSCVFIKMVTIGINPIFAVLLSFLSGALCGIATGVINRFIKIPSVISGLIMSVALYSIGWTILGKPNQFLENNQSLVGTLTGSDYNFALFFYIFFFLIFLIAFLNIFSNSIWGLKIKAIGENPILAKSLTNNESLYYLLLLGLSNGIIAVSGTFFLQRSFSADINMGVGQTIVGLTSMLIGLLIMSRNKKTILILLSIALGAIIYKVIIFYTLEFGLPAEYFKLVTSVSLIVLFLLMRTRNMNLLKGLKWN